MACTVNFDEITDYLKMYSETEDESKKRYLQNIIALTLMPLVKKISRAIARRKTDPIEDIIQAGNLGLIKAIQKYKYEGGKSFKSYATYFITGEIKHYLRDQSNMIRVPRDIFELSYRINKLMRTFNDCSDERGFEKVLAAELGTSVGKIKEALEIDRRKNALSLDFLITTEADDTMAIYDKLADDSGYDLEALLEDKIMLNNAINRLDKESREIIIMKYFEDLSQREIAEKLGMNSMMISRRTKRALKNLILLLSSNKQKKKKNIGIEEKTEIEKGNGK